MTEAVLGLGSNLGDRVGYLAKALDGLESHAGIELVRVSSVYHSPPWGVVEQPDFLNLCVRIRTRLAPRELLHACKTVEADLGRTPNVRWGPREIDLDIVLMDGIDIDGPDLAIPHPRFADRRFVLEPLDEIASAWVVDGVPVSELAEALRRDEPEMECDLDERATQRLAELRAHSH